MKPMLQNIPLLENLPDALVYLQIVTDPSNHPIDDLILHVNPAFCKLVQRKPNRIIGQALSTVLPPSNISKQERMEIYSQVTKDRESVASQEYFPQLQRLYHNILYQERPGFFISIYRDITETKNRIDTAPEEIQRYFNLFKGSRDGFVIVDPRGKIIEANPAFCSMIGYEIQELKEMDSFYSITPKKWWEWEQKEIWEERLLRNGYTGIYEKEYLRKDGTVFPVELQSYAIRDEKDSIIYLWGVARDITARKKAEEELRKSEENYREIFHSVNDAIFIHHIETGEILDVNNPALKMYGCQHKNEIRNHMNDFHHTAAGYTQKKAQEMIQAARIEKKKTFEWQARKKNGEVFWVEVSLKRTMIGEEERILAVVHDIQERKEWEKRLKKSEELFRQFAESAPMGIVISDEQEKTLYVNKKFTRLFGYTKEEVPSVEKWWILAYPNETLRSRVQKKWQQAITEAKRDHTEVKPLEYPVTCKNGVVRQIEFRLSSIGHLNMVTFVDTTQRKQQEKKLIEYTQRMEDLYQKLDEEMNKAHQIHKLLLPKKLPAFEQLSFAAHYQPAKKVGGDFYDIIHIHNKIVFYLLDVSGHGLDSAMMSFFVKHTMKGYLSFASVEAINPSSILKYLAHQFKKENYPADYFICIFLGVFDRETFKFTYSAAGFHDTPFVQLGDGEQLKLKSKGLFIHAFFSQHLLNFKEEEIFLTPGTTILFNTDGLSEQMCRGEKYADVLPELFFLHAHRSPDQIIQVLVEDFCAFNNNSPQGRDDITVFVLQIKEKQKENFHLQLRSDFNQLQHLRARVVDILGNVQERDRLITCLYELAANAVEHGNRLDPEKMIHVELTMMEQYIKVLVRDEGAGFHWRKKIGERLELEGKTVRGRGIAMTRLFSDSLFYNRRGNQVGFIIKKTAPVS